MKKVILVLFLVLLCTTVFASVRLGVSAMANTPFYVMSSKAKEKNYEAIKEEVLKNNEITARASLDLMNLDFGIEAGVCLFNETVTPVAKVYGGLKVPVLKVLEMGLGVGYRLEFGDGDYTKNLYWRLAGGVNLGTIWLEGIATMPIMEGEEVKDVFNFGTKVNSARFGLGLGIKL